MPAPAEQKSLSILSVEANPATGQLVASVHWLVLGALFAVIALLLLATRRIQRRWSSYEIDEAEFGAGSSKFKIRPNTTDRQVAYAIWVELSTRKIGLPIDLSHDLIDEIYDSWYNFFGITRELIKSIPVHKLSDKSTERIVRLSIEVLNEGLRPHLTQWQARFRRYYEWRVSQPDAVKREPQLLQCEFPEFEKLSSDMRDVNDRLMRYRKKMSDLVYGVPKKARTKKPPPATSA